MVEPNKTGIERQGNNFAIVHYDGRGVKSELVLSEGSILTLATAFPRLLREQLATKVTPQMAQQGIEPVIRTLVTRTKVALDLHGAEILVHFQDELRNWTVYGIAPDLAEQVGEHLTARAKQAKRLGADVPRQ